MFPIFSIQRDKNMKNLTFTSLEEAIDCYKRENLIPIDNIKQIIFYTKHGAQPKIILENELRPGRLTAWFLKSETDFIYRKWMKSKP